MGKGKWIYKKGKCLIEGCPNKDKIYARGLCLSHYEIMRRTILKGIHSWKEFEDYEMALPFSQKQSKSKKVFEKMLIEKKK